MAQSAGKVDCRLQDAMKNSTPVTVRRRRLNGTDDLDGLVDQVTPGWVVLAALEDTVYPNGFEVIRRRDITKVIQVSTARAAYIDKALGNLGRKQVECPFTVPADATTRELLEVVAGNTPTFGFHIEGDDPGVLFIGRLARLRAKTFDLLFIDANGRWEDSNRRWKYKQVSRITFGNRCQRALEKYGDPLPASLD